MAGLSVPDLEGGVRNEPKQAKGVVREQNLFMWFNIKPCITEMPFCNCAIVSKRIDAGFDIALKVSVSQVRLLLTFRFSNTLEHSKMFFDRVRSRGVRRCKEDRNTGFVAHFFDLVGKVE